MSILDYFLVFTYGVLTGMIIQKESSNKKSFKEIIKGYVRDYLFDVDFNVNLGPGPTLTVEVQTKVQNEVQDEVQDDDQAKVQNEVQDEIPAKVQNEVQDDDQAKVQTKVPDELQTNNDKILAEDIDNFFEDCVKEVKTDVKLPSHTFSTAGGGYLTLSHIAETNEKYRDALEKIKNKDKESGFAQFTDSNMEFINLE